MSSGRRQSPLRALARAHTHKNQQHETNTHRQIDDQTDRTLHSHAHPRTKPPLPALSLSTFPRGFPVLAFFFPRRGGGAGGSQTNDSSLRDPPPPPPPCCHSHVRPKQHTLPSFRNLLPLFSFPAEAAGAAATSAQHAPAQRPQSTASTAASSSSSHDRSSTSHLVSRPAATASTALLFSTAHYETTAFFGPVAAAAAFSPRRSPLSPSSSDATQARMRATPSRPKDDRGRRPSTGVAPMNRRRQSLINRAKCRTHTHTFVVPRSGARNKTRRRRRERRRWGVG